MEWTKINPESAYWGRKAKAFRDRRRANGRAPVSQIQKNAAIVADWLIEFHIKICSTEIDTDVNESTGPVESTSRYSRYGSQGAKYGNRSGPPIG
jgi:hypothetical protein